MRVESPVFKKIARTAVLLGGLTIPASLAAIGCSPDLGPSAQIISSRGEDVKSELSHDTSKYPYKTVILVHPYNIEEHAVEFYTLNEPAIDISGNLPQITLDGTVYCSNDSDGPVVGCSNDTDKFFNGAKFTLVQGGINVIKRYSSKELTKDLSTEDSSYKYKVAVQVETGGGQDKVNIYTNAEPFIGKAGSLPVVTVENAFCPSNGSQAEQIGCEKFMESITFFGGWSSTTITKQK